MAKVMTTNEEIRLDYQLFSDVWRLFKTYYDVPSLGQQSYWKALMDDIDILNHKYNNILCRDLLITVVDELERKAGNLKKGTSKL